VGDCVSEAVVVSDRKLLWTLLILAAAVLGWTLAVDLEIGRVAIAGLAAALVLALVIWFWPERHDSDEPPP
jgi:hypothetical protein